MCTYNVCACLCVSSLRLRPQIYHCATNSSWSHLFHTTWCFVRRSKATWSGMISSTGRMLRSHTRPHTMMSYTFWYLSLECFCHGSCRFRGVQKLEGVDIFCDVNIISTLTTQWSDDLVWMQNLFSNRFCFILFSPSPVMVPELADFGWNQILIESVGWACSCVHGLGSSNSFKLFRF